jgi:hypothetical protein
MPGFDPAMGEKKDSSSARVLKANIAVTRQVAGRTSGQENPA